MSWQISPFGNDQFFLSNGALVVGAKLFTYLAGTTTKTTTYTDINGSASHTNPIILNSLGMPPSPIFIQQGVLYKFVYAPSTDTDPPTAPLYTVDGVDTGSSVASTGFNMTGGINEARTTVASAATPDIFAVTVGNTVDYTGTTTCTGFVAAPQAGAQRTLVCAAAAPFTAGANFLIDGVASGQTYTAFPGERLTVVAVTTTQFRLRGADRLDKHISGFTYSNNVTDATNDIDFAAGVAMDATGVYLLRGSAVTKQLDVAWAVGTNQGMLDTGAVGNNDYYFWVIGRSDTGVVDYVASLSSTSPTMPTNYDYKRLIGWIKRVAGTNVAFRTYETEGGGLELLWSSPTLDVNLANTLTTTRRTDAVKVPLNFSTTAILNVTFDDVTGGYVYLSCPDLTDLAPSQTVAPLAYPTFSVAGIPVQAYIQIRTSSTGTIAARAFLTVDAYRVVTLGFLWARRN